MRRKLSTIEHILDGNIVYFVRLEGRFTIERLRTALARVQGKHPSLRALIREEKDGLYYEMDSAPEIPLRIVRRLTEDDYRRECETELNDGFVLGQPQLRAVWLYADLGGDLLLTTSHRICDGASILTLVREILYALHSDEELVPYQPINMQDIIGDYRPPRLWKRRLAAFLISGLIRMIPGSRPSTQNNKFYLEWEADRDLTAAWMKRRTTEGVSVHAGLAVLLDRALFAVCGEKKLPPSIHTQMDIRRSGRLSRLKGDMLFFAGGALKMQTGQGIDTEFWARARTVYQEMPKQIEEELRQIPARCHFFEMVRPPTSRQLNMLARLSQMFKGIGVGNNFMLSNLGNIVLGDAETPFEVKDLRLYAHSSRAAVIGLVAYTFKGEMRFYYCGDEKQQSRGVAEALKREFMAAMRRVVSADDSGSGVFFSESQEQHV